ncbi:hypothetical protein BHF71_01275 [Vulcanibacillus modesticaldus]|uniref:ATP synthase subunit I n=1 Tax=Vulcanibacillus modesticaldus TaxID=337097 RepID=A0A1D2YVU2_9BACI|nr:ATP synthase subunit I [Vulcanibacillus modesticaldus]OEF99834.1 hypothetical protein BHF71_01275 [Vulcanibacillus modesticaldus]
MKEYKLQVKRIFFYTVSVFLVMMIGTLTPFSFIFKGLALGTFISLLNVMYTAYKVNKIGELVLVKDANNRRRYISSGMSTRMATSLLAVMVVYKYPQQFNLFSTLIGLFVAQIISVVDGIKTSIKSSL